jgi:hypothetical protein
MLGTFIGKLQVHLHSSMTTVSDGGNRSVSRSGRFAPPERTPLPIKQEAVPEIFSGHFWRYVSFPCWDSNPGSPSLKPELCADNTTPASADMILVCSLRDKMNEVKWVNLIWDRDER